MYAELKIELEGEDMISKTCLTKYVFPLLRICSFWGKNTISSMYFTNP